MAGDYDEGLTARRRVLGDAWVDKSLAGLNDFNSDFQNFITRYVWGEIWTRPGIDERTRRFMVLSTMMALGRWEEFQLHVGAALRSGFTRDDIKEIILQQSVYCGVPSGNHATAVAQKVIDGMKA